MKRLLKILLLISCPLSAVQAQNIIQENNQQRSATDSIEKENVPEGIYAWRVGTRFGEIRPTQLDTIPHLFQNQAFTDGLTGRYNFLGNLGSPRISRIFTDRNDAPTEEEFIFTNPYDFFLQRPDQVLFTNTKSPFTNITLHECGDKQSGESRLKGAFSTNINKRLGMGFVIDYLYGRGYYSSQNTSQLGGTLFASYLGKNYKMHTLYSTNFLKTSENGGIENDAYITNPESFPTKYGTEDMPTNLSKTYNKMHLNTFFLTHNYSIGFSRFYDKEGKIVRTQHNKISGQLLKATDSTRTNINDSLLREEFVPVTSFIHTFQLSHNNRRFLSNLPLTEAKGFFHDFYLPADSANDMTKFLHLRNTLAIELHEGFNKWVKTGLRLFAQHDFYNFSLPDTLTTASNLTTKQYKYNYLTLGAQLLKEKGKYFRYHVLGELRTTGAKWGEFNVEGNVDFTIPFHKDSLFVNLDGYVRRWAPAFYFDHYHARNAWWDKQLNKQFSTRIGGSLHYKQTKLSLHIENIQNYPFFAQTLYPYTVSSTQKYTHSVNSSQKTGNLQLIAATLTQNFHWGILHWENEITWQATSDTSVYPLPSINLWTNLYLKFKIAKVLKTELGADMRFFTKYDALAYSPIVGEFAIQDPQHKVTLGNYPLINAYANFDLKRTRFYVMVSHLNYSSGNGKPFLVPHYPLNRLIFRLGISWNFIN